ncbi:MAG TPA: 50S ribosomal protein L3 [Patescibacteria group bacterium]|nr:50S ribosomal protein L3 [Patescibacteria group bacterium]
MLNTLLGIKKEMSSGYDTRGRRVAVTKITVSPNFITQVKTVEKDGYASVQVATGSKKSVKKPQKGHFKKAGVSETLRFVKETRTTADETLTAGTEIAISKVLRKGDEVKVTGTEKGRGFQGGVRRHGFHGVGMRTHGQSDRQRAPGSIGTGTTPGRVLKGKRMAGHMGAEKATTRGLEVIEIDRTNNIVSIKGAVPGPYGGLVMITKTGVIKGYTPPPEEKEDEEEVASDKEQMAAGDSAEVPAEVEKTEETKQEESASAQAPADKEGEENANS